MKRLFFKLTGSLLALCLLLSIMPVKASALEEPSQEELYRIYSSLAGHATLYADWRQDLGYIVYFDTDDQVSDAVIYYYLRDTGALAEYETGDLIESVKISYEKYMAIVDRTFVNHSDMKSYLEDIDGYDPETGMVTVSYIGGAGGGVYWEALSTYREGDAIYIQGLYLNDEKVTDDMELYYDYYPVTFTYENSDHQMVSETKKMSIQAATEVKLVNVEGCWKIAAYTEMDYYVINGTAYVGDSDGKTAYQSFDINCDKGVSIKAVNGKNFEDTLINLPHSNRRFYESGMEYGFTIEPEEGYEIVSITYEDNRTGGELASASNGVYSIIPDGPAVLTVSARRIDGGSTEDGDAGNGNGNSSAGNSDGTSNGSSSGTASNPSGNGAAAESPKTGDETTAILWIALLAVSCTYMVYELASGRLKNRDMV